MLDESVTEAVVAELEEEERGEVGDCLRERLAARILDRVFAVGGGIG